MSRTPPPEPTDRIDAHVGERVRLRRRDRKLSLPELAKTLNISAQQLGKCELGQAGIRASRLYAIARALETPVGWFYLGAGPAPAELEAGEAAEAELIDAFLRQVEGARLMLTCAHLRRADIAALQTIADRLPPLDLEPAVAGGKVAVA